MSKSQDYFISYKQTTGTSLPVHKEIKVASKTKLLLWLPVIILKLWSTIFKMSRCFPQVAKNYIIMWCSQLLCKRVQRSLPKKIWMQTVRLTRALSLVSAYSDGSPTTPSILPLTSEHLWAGLNVCCAMMSGFN